MSVSKYQYNVAQRVKAAPNVGLKELSKRARGAWLIRQAKRD